LPEPAPGTVNIKICLAPINPADLNAIEGVYPSKHILETRLNTSGDASQDNPVYVPGNEAVAQVTQVANDVTGLKPGDWVIMGKAQLGTWMSVKNVHHRHLIPVASPGATLTDVHLATIAVSAALLLGNRIRPASDVGIQ
jgi:trans-2-enoyl-CoA reductase